MKKYKTIIVVLFLLIMITPIVFINLKENQISEIDNDMLPEKSDITNVESLENYVSKRLGFRTDIIKLYTNLNNDIFGEMIHPVYDYGQDNYVYFKFEGEMLDEEYLDSYANLVKKVQNYVKERGSYFLYVLNPSKKAVQKDFLPKGYKYNEMIVNYLEKRFDELGINYINNTELLIEKAKENPTFNKQYDAGHWNDYGAFYGIQNIFNKLNNDNVFKDNISIDEYEIGDDHKDSLLVSEFEISENVPLFELKEKLYKEYDIRKDIYINQRFKNVLRTINDSKTSSLLMFRGSYIIGRDKFISNKFGDVYYIHNYQNAINYDYYYNLANKPKIVIFTGVDYAISETYFEKEQMDLKSNNELYKNGDDSSRSIYNLNDFDMNIDINDSYITYSFINNNLKNAYLLIDGEIYDFSKIESKYMLTLEENIIRGKNIKIVLDNN